MSQFTEKPNMDTHRNFHGKSVTILSTVSNQEVTLNRLISMLWIAQKLYVGAYIDLCEMYNNVPKGIRLLDKKAFFVYTGKNSCK